MVIIIDGLYKYCTFTAQFFCYPESLTFKSVLLHILISSNILQYK